MIEGKRPAIFEHATEYREITAGTPVMVESVDPATVGIEPTILWVDARNVGGSNTCGAQPNP